MTRYAIIDTATNRIITVVEYANPPGNPPPGFGANVIAVQNDRVGPDWTFDGSNLIPPHVSMPPPLVELPQPMILQADPYGDMDATTKRYVDEQISQLREELHG